MQNSNNYWRAAHPLVFICSYLLLGVYIANCLPKNTSLFSPQSSFLILLGELLLLWLSTRIKIKPLLKGCIILCIIVSWGSIISFNSMHYGLLTMPGSFEKYISFCRNSILLKINKNILPKAENGFALALLLGVKADMNKELLNAYTQLGIIHIIAISGMHLDILFKTLTRLTHLLPSTKFFKLIELLLLLIIVWTYTFMANAGPSIVRASMFFSIFMIGRYFELAGFTLNYISGGIFILILTNVHGITHIGLQLSYAAVIGIHLFYKIIYRSIPLQNPIIQFLWSNCCVSLAAQLTTFPILVLHFHQVASWVLVSNFIMVPLSNLILYGLVLVLLLPQQLAVYGGACLSQYMQLFNKIVQVWFMNTKAGTMQISMNGFQVLFYYLLLILAYLWIYQKNTGYFLLILGLAVGYIVIKLFS